MNLSYPKIALAGTVLALLGLAVFFRGEISSLLSVAPKPGDSIDEEAEDPGLNSDPEKKEDNNSEARKNLPAYQGRDLAEFRPNPEEVKLYSKAAQDKFSADIEMHARAIKTDPDFLFGWIEIGLLKKIIGDFEGARDAWEYAGLIRPTNSVSFANLGELYQHYLPDHAKAEKNFRRAVTNKPDDVMVYVSFSDLYSYSYKEKAGLADDILLEGLQANPGDVNLMKALAALYEREGDKAKALEWWQKVLAEEPDNSGVKATIEELKKTP